MAEGFAMRDLDYLRLLSREYPTVRSACSEIINLRAIMGLPKGTEYFFSDLHGEFAEKFIRDYPGKNQADFRVYYPGGRAG